MFKTLLTLIITLFAAAAFAAVDVNTASEAELDGIKGIGPGLSSKILDERRKTPFKDWNDFISRVNGVGNKSAANFSTGGLTVNGKKFSAAAAAKAEDKKIPPAAPVAKTPPAAAPAPVPVPAAPAKTPLVAPKAAAPAVTDGAGKR